MSNTPVTCAVADLGSNTFHLMIADVEGIKFTVIDKIRYPVKLATGFDDEKNLTEEAMQRAFSVIERYGQRLQDFPPKFVKIVGTNALRRARNSREFVKRATEILGYPVEVISGYEEARLIYIGVARSIESDGRRRLLIDIGGGSTELVIGQDFTPLDMESLDVGCLSSTVEFFPDGKITKQSMHDAVISVGLKIQPFVSTMKSQGWDMVIGSAGSIIAISKVLLQKGWTNGNITFAALDRLRMELVDQGCFDGKAYPDISADRVNAFAGGVAVLFGVMKNLDIDSVLPCDGGLREGMLLDLCGRIEHKDIRDTAILQFSKSYKYDEKHSARVAEMALRIFGCVQEKWGVKNPLCRDYLRWAASCFEIGLSISHSRYHKHSAYLVKHVDLAGFTREEQEVLRTIVKGHRRSFPNKLLAVMSEDMHYTVSALCVIFRLAVIFTRSRSDIPFNDVEFDANFYSLNLIFPKDWLQQNPLTEADLMLEHEYLFDSGWSLNLVT